MPAVWRPPADSVTPPQSQTTDQLRFSATLTLAAVPTAVGAARRYARNELTKAKLAALIDDAELIISELVTNAVIATGVMAAEPKWPELEGLAVIRIRLGFGPSSIFIEVWDHDPELPIPQQASEYAEGGRGLLIVNTLCTRWSARTVADGGKVVWGELPVPVPVPVPEELPRRMPKRRPAPGPRGTSGPLSVGYRSAGGGEGYA
jgi:anti-sigma regulatory factor (Ser/Thr protein kinase)